MKIKIYMEEIWPFYELDDGRGVSSTREVEVSEADYEAYLAASKVVWAFQNKLGELYKEVRSGENQKLMKDVLTALLHQ